MRVTLIVLTAVCAGLFAHQFALLGQTRKEKAKAAASTSLVCRNAGEGEPTGVVGITIHAQNNRWERTTTAESAKFYTSVRGPWIVVSGVLKMRNAANTDVAGEMNPDPRGKASGTHINGRSYEKGLILTCTTQ